MLCTDQQFKLAVKFSDYFMLGVLCCTVSPVAVTPHVQLGAGWEYAVVERDVYMAVFSSAWAARHRNN